MLSITQEEVLRALTGLYRSSNSPVKGEEIAKHIDKHEGTVRNQMMSLRALRLVKSMAGPKGGYQPTPKAFEYLSVPESDKLEITSMRIEDTTIGVAIADIDLLSMSSSQEQGAEIRLVDGYRGVTLATGQNVILGPTPLTNLIIKGTIIGLYPKENKILLRITGMLSLPDDTAKDLATQSVITITPSTSVLVAAKIFAEEGIRSLPILDNKGHIMGLFTTKNLALLAIEGKLDCTVVEDYLQTSQISANATFTDCLQEMDKIGRGRLLVVDDMKLIGIITRTDLLHRLVET